MRVDHFAYQRATRVAGFGFFLQLIIGIVMLVFSLVTGDEGDTAGLFASAYMLCGVVVWLSLIVVFHQHKLERLEALEEDELAATRSGSSSMFDADDEEIRVAGRRLRKMHRWLMPATSLVLAAGLAMLAWWMWGFMDGLSAKPGDVESAKDLTVFALSPAKGWLVSICLALSAVCFIFSRFVAGMANQAAWQNLRGGAGYMVGTALVLFAVAAGVVFRFFENDAVIEGVAMAMPIFLALIAAEIVLNFIMNLYRPRIPGEVPRPAFDSRVLSILAAPDSLVRSINEAVNYQFGFDVTSTWGYKLLTRSVLRLVVIAIVATVGLSTLVVVEPHQRAILLDGGAVVDDQVHGSGLLVKLPWPLQSAEIYDVTRIRRLNLTAVRIRNRPVHVWRADREDETDREIEPFIVRASKFGSVSELAEADRRTTTDDQVGRLALLDAEISIQFRIEDTDDGLLKYLKFAPETRVRRERLSMRGKALRALALRVTSDYFARMRLDEIIARQRSMLSSDLRRAIQAVFTANDTGVEVLEVSIPVLQPAGAAAQQFEDLAIATQNSYQYKAASEQEVVRGLAWLVGDPDVAPELIKRIRTYNDRANALGNAHADVAVLRESLEQELLDTDGTAGRMIAEAYRYRWAVVLARQAESKRVQGQLPSYRAAPALYQVREEMRVLREQLRSQHKIVLGSDSSHLDIDVTLKSAASLLDAELAITGDQGG